MKRTRNPYILFSPFLLVYITYVIQFPDDVILDNDRYIDFAKNLLNGFYSPPAPNIDLWWGPGYPIILMPFVALELPLISITLLNTIFLYFSVIVLYKTLIKLVPFKLALWVSLFWACCFTMYREMAIIHSETFVALLISLFTYTTVVYFFSNSKRYLYYAGFLLGYLALTKVLFGYVISFLIISCIVFLTIYWNNTNVKKALLILLVAFATTLPYLLYTYNLTQRFFYWGNSGGMSLYWMSSPHENEFGDWNYETLQPVTPNDDTPQRLALLKKTHQKDMEEILQYTGIYRDDAYKRIAWENIKSNPQKFVKNIISNASRLLFDFPFTYSYQRSQLKVFYFSIFFTLSVYSLIITLSNWTKIEFSIRFLLILGFIYLGGSLFLSMYNRMLHIMLPLFLVWIAYVLNKSLQLLEIKQAEKERLS